MGASGSFSRSATTSRGLAGDLGFVALEVDDDPAVELPAATSATRSVPVGWSARVIMAFAAEVGDGVGDPRVVGRDDDAMERLRAVARPRRRAGSGASGVG